MFRRPLRVRLVCYANFPNPIKVVSLLTDTESHMFKKPDFLEPNPLLEKKLLEGLEEYNKISNEAPEGGLILQIMQNFIDRISVMNSTAEEAMKNVGNDPDFAELVDKLKSLSERCQSAVQDAEKTLEEESKACPDFKPKSHKEFLMKVVRDALRSRFN